MRARAAVLSIVVGVAVLLSVTPNTQAELPKNLPDDIKQSIKTEYIKAWSRNWPKTDFSKTTIDITQIRSGGPPKDGIPAIDIPKFVPVSEASFLTPNSPVISVDIDGDVRTYPFEILMFHEIVNDTVGGMPVAITFCPLCNAAIVFERKIDDTVYDFGTSGKLRKSDLVMYDRQSESWWQQFTGEAIIGDKAGTTLKRVPARIESFAAFKSRAPHGKVLSRDTGHNRLYGQNPYEGYDSLQSPFLYDGAFDEPGLSPLDYVVMVGKDAWPLNYVKQQKTVAHNDITITWHDGMSSAMDTRNINEGKNIGFVTVTRNKTPHLFELPFAFAFKAFHPDGTIHHAQSTKEKTP